MREVQDTDMETQFATLLAEVERGETVVITRHGQPVASLVPNLEVRQQQIERAAAAIKEIRKKTGKVTLEEILSSRHEGHRI